MTLVERIGASTAMKLPVRSVKESVSPCFSFQACTVFQPGDDDAVGIFGRRRL